MAPLDDFESILKEVVQAKRLSASKMGKLTEIALRSMENDTQLVSILYRTHKSLPTAAKVSSLYVFDALSRAARHQVNKQGLTGDVNSGKGNCATFLLKVEGVLEGLFQDMIMVGSSESKEKTRKILDIWVKGNTFPSTILSQLSEVVKETEKDPEVIPITTDPRMVAQPSGTAAISPVPIQISKSPAADPQSTLLALLTQAASAAAAPNSGQTTTNTGAFTLPGPPQLDPAQLALLQQLAHTAKLGNGTHPQPIPVPVPPAPPSIAASTPLSGTLGRSSRSPAPYRDEPYNSSRKEFRYDRYDSPERGRGPDDHHDDRSGSSSSFRGGFRGRGRGDGRGRWDDRDRFRDRDWSPPRRARRSRSRSPPSRYGGGRRDVKPYSPPRRPSIAPLTAREQTHNAEFLPGRREIEKDEFGRDIRPQSPRNPDPISASKDIPTQPPPAALGTTQSVEPAPVANNDQLSLSPSVAANTSSQTPATAIVANSMTSQLGMDNFNLATFDFTSPSSWEALGKMWQVTYGYLPSAEELMQFVMSGGTASVPSQSNAEPQGWSEQDWAGSTSGAQTWRSGESRGGFSRGRGGGYGHGNTRDGQERRKQGDNDTDAVLLGGGTDADDMQVSTETGNQVQSTGEGRTVGQGGRMQRVGDRWVFVRDPASMES